VARVHIPALLRAETQGREWVDAEGSTVRAVVRSLVEAYPGLRDRLVRESGSLVPGIVVAIDGEVSSIGLAEAVDPDTEIQFLTAIQGG